MVHRQGAAHVTVLLELLPRNCALGYATVDCKLLAGNRVAEETRRRIGEAEDSLPRAVDRERVDAVAGDGDAEVFHRTLGIDPDRFRFLVLRNIAQQVAARVALVPRAV